MLLLLFFVVVCFVVVVVVFVFFFFFLGGGGGGGQSEFRKQTDTLCSHGLKRLLTESVGYCLNFLTLDVPPQRRSGSGVREVCPGGGCGGMSGWGEGGGSAIIMYWCLWHSS